MRSFLVLGTNCDCMYVTTPPTDTDESEVMRVITDLAARGHIVVEFTLSAEARDSEGRIDVDAVMQAIAGQNVQLVDLSDKISGQKPLLN
jgi:hypothetical protein